MKQWHHHWLSNNSFNVTRFCSINGNTDGVGTSFIDRTEYVFITDCENWDRSTSFFSPSVDGVFMLLYKSVEEGLRSTVDISVSPIVGTVCLSSMRDLGVCDFTRVSRVTFDVVPFY